ncbi:MAG TPA: glycosyltransferase [Verrucomicrobiae bacterium]|nr:glycosyltransferase [Verrucomicrobiae bacterium]
MSPSQESAAPAPLRIVHLNSMLSGGGTDDQCVKLARGLCQLGQLAWLAGPEGRDFSKLAHELQVPFHPTPPEGPLKARFIMSAANFIRAQQIQIVHGHHGRDLWPVILAARLSGGKPLIILTRHLAKSPSSWVSRRFLLNRCDAMIAVSAFVAKVLREGVYEPDSPEPERRSRPPLAGDHSRIHVIHGGIDTSRFKPGESPDVRRSWGIGPEHFVFAVVGGYDLPRGKGQREFLRAAARVAAKLPNARFLIIGRGSLKPVLEQDIADLGLQGRASLTPYCRDMPAAMNAIDCLVHPQVGTEAFPGVLLEAFACGKPVIASALDGIPEGFAIGQQGRLVPPEDVAALADGLLEEAARPRPPLALRQELHQRVAAACSLEAHSKKVLLLYRDLVQARGDRIK